MNRLGWSMLGIVAALLLAVLLTVQVRFGPATAARPPGPADRPAAGGRDAREPLVLPVANTRWTSVHDSWGDARGGGTRAHHGTDIAAARGTPVLAAADGVIEKLFFSRGGGGITAYVRSPDRRLSYYYAHLMAYAPGMREGRRVRAGEPIGFVGDTGNAGRGNTHLHFGINAMRPDERWWQGRPVNPYPLLAEGRRER